MGYGTKKNYTHFFTEIFNCHEMDEIWELGCYTTPIHLKATIKQCLAPQRCSSVMVKVDHESLMVFLAGKTYSLPLYHSVTRFNHQIQNSNLPSIMLVISRTLDSLNHRSKYMYMYLKMKEITFLLLQNNSSK